MSVCGHVFARVHMLCVLCEWVRSGGVLNDMDGITCTGKMRWCGWDEVVTVQGGMKGVCMCDCVYVRVCVRVCGERGMVTPA